MKRLFFASALVAIAAAAALSAQLQQAHGSTSAIPSHVAGLVPPVHGVQPNDNCPPSGCGSGDLLNHGGPVMTSRKAYAIFWVPSGYSNAAGYSSTIDQYFNDVAADSGKATNVYSVDTQYSGIAYSSTYGGSVTDTTQFPASGCPLYNGLSECLTDSQIIAEIDSQIAAHGWTKSASTMFFMFTPNNVGSCFDASSSCAYTAYCAYHGYTPSGAIYANQPYAFNPSCDVGEYPNGISNQADPTINVVSHEDNEAITDPQVNISSAWYDAAGYEIGDKCAWTFGTRSGSAGAQYSNTINGHNYFLQEEYSNDGHVCLQSYGTPGGGPPQITSFAPTRGRAGTKVTLTGKNFTGTTSVKLRFTSAAFIVLSSTQIRATVPTGVTGLARWTVTTPKGSAQSSLFCAC
jgi:hypothetical protein